MGALRRIPLPALPRGGRTPSPPPPRGEEHAAPTEPEHPGEYRFVAPARLARHAPRAQEQDAGDTLESPAAPQQAHSRERHVRLEGLASDPPSPPFVVLAGGAGPRGAGAPAEGNVVAGRYRLDRALRQGGMGAVFQAYDQHLDIEVAVKLVRGDLASPEATERLVREARAAAHVSHRSAVRVIDVGLTERGDPFLVMELLRGESLGEVVSARGVFSPQEAVRLLLPIVDAAAAVHAQGIVHRDIKPQNVLLIAAEDGAVQPMLVDFGIAKLMGEPPCSRITQVGALVGSPEYMAPEQTMGWADVDARVDVWGLCVCLYQIVTGTTPFRRSIPLATLAAIQQDDPEQEGALFGEPELWAIVRRGLAKERGDRWGSARELGRALAGWALQRGIETDVSGTALSSRWFSPTSH